MQGIRHPHVLRDRSLLDPQCNALRHGLHRACVDMDAPINVLLHIIALIVRPTLFKAPWAPYGRVKLTLVDWCSHVAIDIR